MALREEVSVSVTWSGCPEGTPGLTVASFFTRLLPNPQRSALGAQVTQRF